MSDADAAQGLAVLISGGGTNLQAFIDACEEGGLNTRIEIVISNKPDVQGLQRAADAGISTAVVNHQDYDNREDFDRALLAKLADYSVGLIILAGFMRILTPVFIGAWRGRLLNIHPSLLPNYPGLHTHQRAIDAGDSAAGATVHFVTEELDGGPPIVQTRVPVLAHDTAETLAARVLLKEHKIYPLAAQWYVDGRLRLTEEGALLDAQAIPENGIQFAD